MRLRLRETCARNHKSKKPKSLDTADVVRDVETSRFHSLTRILANQRRKLVRTPSMRRPVGVKGIRFGLCWACCFLPGRVATVATLPSALFAERFASLGASWVFSFQPVLPPDCRPRFHLQDESWARRLTQSPELGFRLWLFLSKNVFGFMQPPASLSACYYATVRKALRSPTGDAARRPAFAPLQ